MNKDESLTSVKPTVTVSVCNLGVLLQVKAQRSLELWATYCLIKPLSFIYEKCLIMIYALKGFITTKQGHGMCGDAPLLMNSLWNRFKCCFFNLFVYSLIYLLIYLGIVNNICVKQKGAECDWSLREHNKQFTRKSAKQTKTDIFTVCLCPFIYWVSKDKNVNVFAVTLLLILLTLLFYSGQFPLFVPVSNATSFLYRRCEAVSRGWRLTL